MIQTAPWAPGRGDTRHVTGGMRRTGPVRWNEGPCSFRSYMIKGTRVPLSHDCRGPGRVRSILGKIKEYLAAHGGGIDMLAVNVHETGHNVGDRLSVLAIKMFRTSRGLRFGCINSIWDACIYDPRKEPCTRFFWHGRYGPPFYRELDGHD